MAVLILKFFAILFLLLLLVAAIHLVGIILSPIVQLFSPSQDDIAETRRVLQESEKP